MIKWVRLSIARAAALSLLLLTISVAVVGQDKPLKIQYRLAMPHPSSHLFEVSIEVDIPSQAKIHYLDFQMPKWSPGRYAVFDFAKNVQEVNAEVGCLTQYDEHGIALPKNCPTSVVPVLRVDDQTWRPDLDGNRGATLTLNYKVFANNLSGTFSELDPRHANFNGGCVFMYVVNHKQDPVALSIDPPKDWRIVNGRTDRRGQREWQFANWDIMIDTPTEIGPEWTEDDFKVGGKEYHVVVHSLGNEGGKRRALVRDIEKIVKAETAMWGPPEFDSYTFLVHFAADGRSSDGMEHLTSTQVIMPGSLADAGMYEEALDAIAHEFFHVWNVKRLRPVELGPWDFTRPANTRGLWIAEGITNYYGHLMQRRAGLWNDAQLWNRLLQQITEIENSPGSRLMSAEESSLSAPFIDDAPHAQQTNLANSSVSYYPKGEILGIVLDLLIRGKTNGKASLDEVMRRMYQEFYLKGPNATYYLRGRGFQNEDFEHMVSEVAGTDMSDFFKRYVRGVESPPYEEAFAQVGLRFVREPQQPVSVGVSGDEKDPNNFKVTRVRPGSPAADAGMEIGDTISTFGGTRLTPANLPKVLGRYKPGDRVALTVQRGRRTIQMSIVLGPPQVMNYRLEEMTNAPAEAKVLRAGWLNGK
ncbi:MAG TPA: PDZ domain-containing protein [Pyrinomonadaceae bacterium]|nr:PDZ domain-containing protein [Pyrinomonadaceae bacterium]